MSHIRFASWMSFFANDFPYMLLFCSILTAGELISEECVHNEKFMLSDLPDYYIGEEGDLKHYKEVRTTFLCPT